MFTEKQVKALVKLKYERVTHSHYRKDGITGRVWDVCIHILTHRNGTFSVWVAYKGGCEKQKFDTWGLAVTSAMLQEHQILTQ